MLEHGICCYGIDFKSPLDGQKAVQCFGCVSTSRQYNITVCLAISEIDVEWITDHRAEIAGNVFSVTDSCLYGSDSIPWRKMNKVPPKQTAPPEKIYISKKMVLSARLSNDRFHPKEYWNDKKDDSRSCSTLSADGVCIKTHQGCDLSNVFKKSRWQDDKC